MAFVAISLSQAIAHTNSRVGQANPLSLLLSQISTFNSLWPGTLNINNIDQRTVRNWLPFARTVEAQTPATGNSQQRQNVVNVAVRVMFAAIQARAGGRITVAQRDDVLAAWNTGFGAIPP